MVAGIAVASRTTPAMPEGVVGAVGAPVVRTSRGVGAPVHGDGVTVWVWADAPLVPGERVAVTGVVHTPRGLLDPGDAGPRRDDGEPRRRLRSSPRARSSASATTRALLDRAWRVGGRRSRRGGRRAIDQAGGDPVGAAALRGIVDRRSRRGAAGARPALARVGIYHVLSVSGLHLAVVAGLAFALLRRLVAASPWGGRMRPARWAAPPALVLAIAYTLVTGAQLATLRSLVVIALV